MCVRVAGVGMAAHEVALRHIFLRVHVHVCSCKWQFQHELPHVFINGWYNRLRRESNTSLNDSVCWKYAHIYWAAIVHYETT
jgi:hypothetical protein